MFCKLRLKKYLKKWFISSFSFLIFNLSYAMEVPIDDFSINAYSQNANDYLSAEAEDYNKALVNKEYQNLQVKQFYNHYYNSNPQGLSPWNSQLVLKVLPLVKKSEPEILESFNNQNLSFEHKHYGENFKDHDLVWWN